MFFRVAVCSFSVFNTEHKLKSETLPLKTRNIQNILALCFPFFLVKTNMFTVFVFSFELLWFFKKKKNYQLKSKSKTFSKDTQIQNGIERKQTIEKYNIHRRITEHAKVQKV